MKHDPILTPANRLAAFLSDLRELSRRREIAIEGGIVFMMQPEDNLFGYRCADDGSLSRA